MAKFKVGDRVYFHGRPATIKQVIREPDADCILDVQGDEFYAEDEEITTTNSAPCRSTNAVVANALNARTARNATKSMTLIPAKDGNRLNDFIHYAYFTADGKWKEGDIPYVRKDMLISGLEKELDRAKTAMQAIADALKEAKAI